MRLEFKGFHPKDAHNEPLVALTDKGVEYSNSDTRAFQFIPYEQVAGFSGWIPVYGSIHIYSSNTNLTVHVNFAPEVASDYLDEIQNILKEKTQLAQSREPVGAVS
ncbi:MAG: hypothetical protein AAGC93_12335 [Cyanobacteria bacterium P01_F01_bin.53]